jgi:hypothetical protein
MSYRVRNFGLYLGIFVLGCPYVTRAQNDNSNWLAKYLAPGHEWKNSNRIRTNDQAGYGACSKSERNPVLPEEVEVARHGYYLLKAFKSVHAGSLTIVIAGAGSGRVCADVTQGFVFLNGSFVSELAPDYMVNGVDGDFLEARALGERDFEVDFADFEATSFPDCAHTAHSPCGRVTVRFRVREVDDPRTTSHRFVAKPISYAVVELKEDKGPVPPAPIAHSNGP